MGELSSRGATIVQIVDSVNYVQVPRAAAERFYRQRRSRSGLARADEDLAGNLAHLLPGATGWLVFLVKTTCRARGWFSITQPRSPAKRNASTRAPSSGSPGGNSSGYTL